MEKLKFYLFVTLNLILYQSNSQNLVSANLILEKSSGQVQSILNHYGIATEGLNIPALKLYKITYSTVDVNGQVTVASGSLTVPQFLACNYLPILAWHHGTEYDKTEVSSQGGGEAIVGIIFGSHGYIVTMPDYLGMGDNPGMHPYHHWESEATSSIDLIRASREFLENSLHVHDNNQLFISGYSQGGHATMALHKYIQDNNLYSEFNIVASAPMSGAYDLSGAQYDLIFDADSGYYRSEFIPYILAGYQSAYGNIYDSFSQLYDTPYDTLIYEFLEGNHTWQQWADLIPENYYKFLQDSVLNNMYNDSTRNLHPINKALRMNNLYNWIPKRTVKMLYCGSDSMVSPQNSLNTLDTMTALGATNVTAINIDQNGVHETCFFPSINYAMNWFDGLKVSCMMVMSTSGLTTENIFRVYPNPAKDDLFLNSNLNLGFKIFNIDGSMILSGNFNKNKKIDISTFKPGVYLIVARDDLQNRNFHSLFVKE